MGGSADRNQDPNEWVQAASEERGSKVERGGKQGRGRILIGKVNGCEKACNPKVDAELGTYVPPLDSANPPQYRAS
jgi:hypothetical protein